MRDLFETPTGLTIRRAMWLPAAFALVSALGLVATPSPVLAQQSQDSKKEGENKDKKPDEKGATEVEKALSLAKTAYHAGEWPDAKEAYRKAYNEASNESPYKVEAALGLSSIEWEQGEFASARTHVESALDLAEKLELNSAIGRLLLTLGHIQANQGEIQEAEKTLNHCISLASAQNDPVYGPLCRLNYRMVRKLQGKDIGSDRVYKQALDKLKSVDTPMTVGMSLAQTAQLYSKSGDYKRALSLIDQAERQYQKAASEPAQARIRLDRARLLQDVGKWNAARNALAGLAETFQKMGSKPALVDTYGLLGDDARHRGNNKKAAKYYRTALTYAQSSESPQLIAKVQVALCELPGEPASACNKALETLADLPMPVLKARAHSALGTNYQNAGKLKKARDAYMKVIRILDEEVADGVVSPTMKAANLSNLCQVEAQAGITGAFSRCRDAVSTIEDLENSRPQMLAMTHYALGIAAINEGSPKTGVDHLKTAAKKFQSIDGNQRHAADSWLRAGDALNQADFKGRAATAFKNGLNALDGERANRDVRMQLRTQLAQVLSDQQDWEGAAKVLNALIDDANAAEKPGTAAWAYSALARTRVNRGDDPGAKEALQKGIELANKAGDQELATSMKEDLEQFE